MVYFVQKTEDFGFYYWGGQGRNPGCQSDFLTYTYPKNILKEVDINFVFKVLAKFGDSKDIKKIGIFEFFLSNAHLTPASQAEHLIKKIKNSKKMYVFIIFIITKFGENFEDKINICFF